MRHEYDAVVIGSGPNGLVAAIELARHGHRVHVLEAAPSPGGGLRTEAITLPGFIHDTFATVHAFAHLTPPLRALDHGSLGVEFVQPTVALAHPVGTGAACLHPSLDDTSAGLGRDAAAWRELFRFATDPAFRVHELLDPWTTPSAPTNIARFGVSGVRSATGLSGRFRTEAAPALLVGLAAHGMQDVGASLSGGYAMVMAATAYDSGWPFVRGGSGQLARALVQRLHDLGGTIECGHEVRSEDDVPSAKVVLADTSPEALVRILGQRLRPSYRRRLGWWFRRGPGIFKMDWALDGPVPWTAPTVGDAGTVHLGGTAREVAAALEAVRAGSHPQRPFVVLTQPSLADSTRAPTGKHVVWAYCHVPNGSTVDMSQRIESQIERFAPGFRDRVIYRSTMNTAMLAAGNANLVGGDIAGGDNGIRQFLFRPVLSLRPPWRIPTLGGGPAWYLCSSSVPPGIGTHGMCGWRVARDVLCRELGHADRPEMRIH